jgi:hypothetical protein
LTVILSLEKSGYGKNCKQSDKKKVVVFKFIIMLFISRWKQAKKLIIVWPITKSIDLNMHCMSLTGLTITTS